MQLSKYYQISLAKWAGIGATPPPPPPVVDEWGYWFNRSGKNITRRHLRHLNWYYVQASIKDGFEPQTIPTLEQVSDLAGIKRGKKTGKGGNERKPVADAIERQLIREKLVWLMLRVAFPFHLYDIKDHRKGKQVGADFTIRDLASEKIIAYVDAKPANSMTWPQYQKALSLWEEGTPYWLVGQSFKMQITPGTVFEPTHGKVYNGELS
jgi:hypothetical protein